MNAGGEGSVGLVVMGVLPPVGLLVAGVPAASSAVGNGVIGR